MKQKRNKGFTLVELLAVIVILAVIALIAVPVVMNIIVKARKSAFKDSAYGIIEAGELYYANRLLKTNGMSNDERFTFPNNATGLEISGDKPSDGSMIVTKEGKVAIGITDGKYCITKGFEDTEITVNENYEKCTIPNPIISSTEPCVTSGTCTQEDIKRGVLVNVKVNKEKDYDFYVIADDGENITLIMDKNLGDNVKWYADDNDNSHGPTTALAELALRTKDWENIPLIMDYTYFNNENGTTKTYGYQKLVITDGKAILTSQDGTMKTTIAGKVRARLITLEEAKTKGIGCKSGRESCPSWMYINLNGTGSNKDSLGNTKAGYWTLTADGNDSTKASFGHCTGNVIINVTTDNRIGIRPVITISKTL